MSNPWIFYIIIGVTVIQWVFGKLQEQAAQKRAQQRLGQRPGSPPTTLPKRPVSSASPTITQRELQARRQAQLRALRQRQARLTQRQTPSRAPQTPTVLPRPSTAPTRSSPPVRPPRPAAAPPARRAARAPLHSSSRPLPSRVSRRPDMPQATKRPAAGRQQTKQGERSLHVIRQAHKRAAETFEKDLSEPTTVAKRTGRQPSASLVSAIPLTRADWRRAIIASEILGKPMALRPIES